MNYNLQIQKIILEANAAITTEDKIKLYKQAVNIADSNNDLDWGFELRCEIMYFEKGRAYAKESFPAFAWILDTHDANPDMFDENEILIKYRWMLIAAQKNTDFTFEQIEGIRDDYKRRMNTQGYGLYSHYHMLFVWYMQLGDILKAEECKSQRDLLQPDNVSYCQACEIASNVKLELLSNNFDKATVSAEELLSGRVSCFYEPFDVLSTLIYFLARSSDYRSTLFYQRTEEEFAKLDTSESYLMLNVSYMIFYTSLYNKERAWSLFEKYSEWDVEADDYTSFYFAANLLILLKSGGELILNLNPKLPYFDKSNKYNISDLYDYYYKRAKELALKFDNRNKNSYFSDTLKNLMSF